MGLHLNLCPLIAVFGTPVSQVNFVQKEIINFTSLLAKRHLLLQ